MCWEFQHELADISILSRTIARLSTKRKKDAMLEFARYFV